MWDDRDDDYRYEVRSYYRCPDRLCGAIDCPNCHPGNFQDGVHYQDGVWNEDIEQLTIEQD